MEAVVDQPTAQAPLGEVTAIACSALLVAPDGLGLATRVQACPPQCSVRVWSVPPPVQEEPTTQALAGDTALTPDREAPAGAPLVTTVQEVPFQ
jgi:hypothetical protein